MKHRRMHAFGGARSIAQPTGAVVASVRQHCFSKMETLPRLRRARECVATFQRHELRSVLLRMAWSCVMDRFALVGAWLLSIGGLVGPATAADLPAGPYTK